MVKVGDNEYDCEWCGYLGIKHVKKTAGKARSFGPNPYTRSSGHSRVSNALICPRCGRVISQRRSDGSK